MRISKNIVIAFTGLLVVCGILGTYFVEQSSKEKNSKPNTADTSSNTNEKKEESSNPSSSLLNSSSQENDTKKIQVVDRCDSVTAQVIDEYYQDDQYIYYFPSLQSGCVHVLVEEKDYTIKEALNSKVVTPEEIENTGYPLLKKAKEVSAP